MASDPLQPVADAVLRLAKRQGYVLARDVRSELRVAGASEGQWKEILEQLRPVLVYRQGRYYHKDSFSPRLQKEHAQKQAIQKAIRQLIKQHRSRHKQDERRGQTRVDFIHPIKVHTEDGKEHTLLSRDVSPTGIRLLGTKRLLGQKVQVDLPTGNDHASCRLLLRVLWTCAIGDDLFENGGNFLEMVE
jgi:hypothetical protein